MELIILFVGHICQENMKRQEQQHRTYEKITQQKEQRRLKQPKKRKKQSEKRLGTIRAARSAPLRKADRHRLC